MPFAEARITYSRTGRGPDQEIWANAEARSKAEIRRWAEGLLVDLRTRYKNPAVFIDGHRIQLDRPETLREGSSIGRAPDGESGPVEVGVGHLEVTPQGQDVAILDDGGSSPPPPTITEQVVSTYKAGAGLSKVAAMLGKPVPKVRELLVSAGVEIRGRGRPKTN